MRSAATFALCLAAAPAGAEGLVAASFSEPTTRYAHGALGDAVEWGALELQTSGGRRVTLRLPQTRVFEDTAPRLGDVDGDGDDEAIVVESDTRQGARLAIYDGSGLVAGTPFIGQAFRWLAPLPPADLDGDGRIELSYVDRPHLAKILRVWRFEDGNLVQIAERPGLTNHRIGEPEIGGGIRDCGEGKEIVLADADWRQIMAVRLEGGDLSARPIGPFEGDFAAALSCETR